MVVLKLLLTGPEARGFEGVGRLPPIVERCAFRRLSLYILAKVDRGIGL